MASIAPSIAPRTRRDDILDAATRLFYAKGYPVSTMRDLAQEVGIEAASLYNHVKGKDDILQAICFQMADRFAAHMEQVLSSSLSPIDRLKSVISHHVDMCVTYPEALIVMDNDWQHMDSDSKASFKKLRGKHENHIVQFMREGMDRGQIAPAPPRVLMYTLLSSLKWIPKWYKPERDISVEELKKSVQDLIIMGISL